MKRGVDTYSMGGGAFLVDREGRLFLSCREPQAKNEGRLCGVPA